MKRALIITILLLLLVGSAVAENWDQVATCGAGDKVCCKLNSEGGYDCTLFDANGDKVFTFRSGTKHLVYTNGTILINDGDGGLYYVHDYNKKLLLKCLEINTENGAPYAFESMDGLWGAIDEEGQISVEPTYDSLEALNAPAETYAEELGYRVFQSATGRVGLMDTEGNIVLPAEYELITPPVKWADGSVRVGLRKNQLWGWYGSDGQTECVFLHEVKEMFGEYLLATRPGEADTVGPEPVQLCDPDGTAVQTYNNAEKLSDERLAVHNGETWQLLDRDLNVLFETPYTMEKIYGDRIKVYDADNMKYGYVSADDGHVIVDVVYDYLSEMYGGHTLAVDSETAWIIDSDGNVLYSQAKADEDNDEQGEVLENGCIILKTKDDTYPKGNGYVPLYNYTVLDPDLEKVCVISGNWLGDYKNGSIVYFDEERNEDIMIDSMTGREIMDAPSIDLLHQGEHALVCLNDPLSVDPEWTLYDTDGNRLLKGTYKVLYDTDPDGIVCAQLSNREQFVYMDLNENIVLQGDWNFAFPFEENGYAIVDDNSCIDRTGAVAAPYEESDDVWF